MGPWERGRLTYCRAMQGLPYEEDTPEGHLLQATGSFEDRAATALGEGPGETLYEVIPAARRVCTIPEMTMQKSFLLLLPMSLAVLGGFFVVHYHAAGKSSGLVVSTNEREKKARLGADLASHNARNLLRRRAPEMKGLEKKTSDVPLRVVPELPSLPIPSYDTPDQQAIAESLSAEAASAGVALSGQEIEAAEVARLAALGMTPQEHAAVVASLEQARDSLEGAASSEEAGDYWAEQ